MKRLFCVLPLAAVLFVAGCGGGGGGGSPATDSGSSTPGTRSPLPTLVEDHEPTGVRLDLRAKNYFPSGQGDNWTYNVTHNGTPASGETTRSISEVDSTHFLVTENNGTSTPNSTQYSRSAGGHVLSASEFLGSGAPASAQKIVGSLVEYPEPFFPVGGERRLVRQGDWGADLDGDGVNESFRLEYTQTLVGFETLQTLLNVKVESAHFRTAIAFTLVASNPAKADVTVVATENTWWAATVGLIQANRETRLPDGSVSTGLLRVSGGTVGGNAISESLGIDGTLVKIDLPHTSLIFDKAQNRYLATVPGSVVTNGNSLAMIDAATGAVTYSRPLGSEPSVLALSAAGDFLYVGFKSTGDVVKYRMADMAEQWRVRLQSDVAFGQSYASSIAVSPANSDLIVVSSNWGQGNTDLVMVRSGVVLPRLIQVAIPGTHIAFDGNGQYLYAYDGGISSGDLRKLQVLSNGLSVVQSRTTDIPFFRVGVSWTADGLWLGTGLYQITDLSTVGAIGTSMTYCVPLSNPAKVVCIDNSNVAATHRLLVADAKSFVMTATPVYRVNPYQAGATYVVPGAANQVALRLGDLLAEYTYYSSIWLFTSTALN